MNAQLNYIFREAEIYKPAIDKDELYETLKRDISALNLPPSEYEDAVRKLCTIIGV